MLLFLPKLLEKARIISSLIKFCEFPANSPSQAMVLFSFLKRFYL